MCGLCCYIKGGLWSCTNPNRSNTLTENERVEGGSYYLMKNPWKDGSRVNFTGKNRVS
jgi:hypothetical protein